jgi:hypothetical protein
MGERAGRRPPPAEVAPWWSGLPVEFMPVEAMFVGMRLEREERCETCKQDQRHEYVCQSARPRRWLFRCLSCASR